jgi:mono/diheme cytochrome c family protein
MSKPLLLVSLPLPMVLPAATQQTAPPAMPTTKRYYVVPLDAAKKENPIKPTAESLARGKRQYGYDCAMCHGKEGDGKRDVAIDMKLKMHDYTDPASLKDRTDGELFYIIKNGKDQMPPEATA